MVKNVDALELLRGQSARLVFMDPPFNIGEPYEGCWDRLPDDKYLMELKHWISSAAYVATDSLWLNLPDRWAAEAVIHARALGMALENWCVWHYRFAQCQPTRFLRSKTHALWFSHGNPYVNAEAARVPSDRATLYGDPRVFDTERGGTRMDFDVWGFDKYWGRVQGNNKERGITPNQLPEMYLKRVIEVCTQPGDLVIDPFCGSGTTATVAHALGRRYLTGDTSAEYCKAAERRIAKGMVR